MHLMQGQEFKKRKKSKEIDFKKWKYKSESLEYDILLEALLLISSKVFREKKNFQLDIHSLNMKETSHQHNYVDFLI